MLFAFTSCQTSKHKTLHQEKSQNSTGKSDISLKSTNRPVDKVYPLLDAANSRWFFFASACRPFGMVNLSPDTQVGGAWGSGYKYKTDTIKGFSHIHAWQMAGVSLLPVSYENSPQEILDDYSSQFFHKYSFSANDKKAIVFQLAGRLGPTEIAKGELVKLDNYTLEGKMINLPTRRRPKNLTVYFHIKFDQAISEIINSKGLNSIVTFAPSTKELNMKVALSYTSASNAAQNMASELPHWDFGRIVRESKHEWNQLLSRIDVSNEDSIQQRRFYTDLWHALQDSLLVYYQDGGLIPRGPSGGNYTYVMTGSSATPFLVSAYQKGIRNYDVELLYEGLKKNHLSGGIMAKAGYEHKTLLGGGLDYYIKNGFVPHPIPEGKFGYHQDGASLTMEYAYQDWTLAQLAKELGKNDDHKYFSKRSKNYKNVFDNQVNWMRPKNINGEWKEPYDPYQYEHGFNESNGVQSTWFVGHDIEGLAKLMGGNATAVQKLNAQFAEASKLNFTPGNSHERGEDPTRARIPINYGNQPSIQTAFIFNHLGRPDLTQYWSSQVAQKTFGGLSPFTGYSGDEDQGLMGSLAVLIKLGLFQLTGGTEANPIYEFGSPLFNNVTIQTQDGKELIIKKSGNGVYIDQVRAGGILEFKMKTKSTH